MPSKKKTSRKKSPPPARPPSGLFGKKLHEKLKTAPPGASDDTILMEALRSVPVEQVKAALKKAHPKEQNSALRRTPQQSNRVDPPFAAPRRARSVGPARSCSAARADRRAARVHSHDDLPERPVPACRKGSELVADVQRGLDSRAHLAAAVGMGVGL